MPDDREQFAKNAKKSGDVMERALDMLGERGRFKSGGAVPFDVTASLVATALTQSHGQVARAHEEGEREGIRRAAEVAKRFATESRFVGGSAEGAIQHRGIIAGANAVHADIASLLPAQPNREPSDG